MGARGIVVGLVGVVLCTSACGGGGGGGGGGAGSTSFADESGPDIINAAAADMGAVTSMHFAGDITNTTGKIHVDLRSSTAGDCQGSFTVGKGTAQIVASNGKAWMKPDHAFWEAQAPAQAAQVEKLVGDKWVSIPFSSGLSKVCDLGNLLKKLTPSSTKETTSTKVVGTSQVDGTDAVQVQGRSKHGDTVSAWVATSSPHHVLKLEVTTGKSPGTLVFSEFDTLLAISTPAPDDVAVIPGS